MKKTTTLFILLSFLLSVNAQLNWTYNTGTSQWEKDITPDMLKFTTKTTEQVQQSILIALGGGNPNPTVTKTTGQDLSNGYLLVTGGQISSTTEPTLTNVRNGYNIINATLETVNGKFLRLATINAAITEGTKSGVGGYFNLNWYIPTKYNYTGYTLSFKDSLYQSTAWTNTFLVYDEGGNQLGTTQNLNAAGWNTATFTQTTTLPFRFKMSVPNTSGLIAYYTQPKFLLTKATEPTVRTITVTNTGEGVTSTQYATVRDQDVQIYTFTPNAGRTLVSVKYNGADVTSQVVNNTYTTPLLTANGTLEVIYSIGTGINKNDMDNIKISVRNKTLNISGLNIGENLAVYNVSGKLIYTKTVNAASVSIPLEKGIYLVKLNNKTVKINI